MIQTEGVMNTRHLPAREGNRNVMEEEVLYFLRWRGREVEVSGGKWKEVDEVARFAGG